MPSTTIKPLKLYHNCVSGVVVLKLQGASESSGKFVKIVGALLLEFLIHRVWGGAQEYEFITFPGDVDPAGLRNHTLRTTALGYSSFRVGQ